jgi:hypothetical protein
MRRRFVSAAEAAALLGVTRETARHYAASGQVAAVRTSAGWMLDADEVEALARGRGGKGEDRMIGEVTAAAGVAIAKAIERGAIHREDAPIYESMARRGQPVEWLLNRIPGNRPRVAAAAPAKDDGEIAAEFSDLWPPRTRAEADLRAHVAASAERPLSDDDLYDSIWSGQ